MCQWVREREKQREREWERERESESEREREREKEKRKNGRTYEWRHELYTAACHIEVFAARRNDDDGDGDDSL